MQGQQNRTRDIAQEAHCERLSLQAGSCHATILCLMSSIQALAECSVMSRASTVHCESMLCLKLSQHCGIAKGVKAAVANG